MRRKPTNRSSYSEVIKLYEIRGLKDYCLRNADDILFIHGFDIRETTGYEELTEEQKKLFEAYVLEHMNSVGMNTKITMWPKSVHYVREYSYCGYPEWDEDEQKNLRRHIGREWVILKSNGRTKKFKKYMDDEKTTDDIDSSATTETEYLRVDWKQLGSSVWFHVLEPNHYY